jgi:phage-related protein
MTASADFVLAKNQIEQPDGRFWLVKFELPDGTCYRITSNGEAVTWDGAEWKSWDFKFSGFRRERDGTLNRLTLTLSDPPLFIRTLLRQHGGLRGVVLRRWICMAEHTDSDDPFPAGVFTVSSATSGHGTATLTLGNEDINRFQAPANVFSADQCDRDFKGEGCGYLGTLATCDKTLCGANGCLAHRQDMLDNGHAAEDITIPEDYGAWPTISR